MMHSIRHARDHLCMQSIAATCARCGLEKPAEAFQPNARMASGLHSWCRACKAEYDRGYRARTRRRKRLHVQTCVVCHRPFRALRSDRIYCSTTCRKSSERARSRSRRAKASFYAGWCPECGSGFVGRHRGSVYCSEECCERVHSRRARHETRGCPPGGDLIGFHALGERDHWTCHVCNEPVDRSIPRTGSDPGSATLDHIVPAADGGPTTWGNVRLAHRACNEARARV
jgi:predicted nucleic acid-binding Zn ribbon protein